MCLKSEGEEKIESQLRFVSTRRDRELLEHQESTHPRLENIGESLQSDLLRSSDSVVSHPLLSEQLLVLPHPPNPLPRGKSWEEDQTDDSDGDGDAGVDLGAREKGKRGKGGKGKSASKGKDEAFRRRGGK